MLEESSEDQNLLSNFYIFHMSTPGCFSAQTPFPANEKPATALTVAGYLDLENQRYPRRASEWVAVTRDCDHSRKSGVSSMVDWCGNPTNQYAIPKV